MTNICSFTIDQLLTELKSRKGVYYRTSYCYEDPVLNPEDGVIHIYDIREDAI